MLGPNKGYKTHKPKMPRSKGKAETTTTANITKANYRDTASEHDGAFLVIFLYCSSKEISISDLSHNKWDLGVHRSLSPVEMDEW